MKATADAGPSARWRRSLRLLAFAGLASLILSGTGRATPDESQAEAETSILPGLWETTFEIVSLSATTSSQEMALPKPPPITSRSCVTAEDVSDFGRGYFSDGAETSCTSEDFSMADGRLRGTIQCNDAGTRIRVTMDGRYTPTSMEFDQHVETTASEIETRHDFRATFHRVGDCPG